MAYNYRHPQYLAAREGALARSGGVCQFCGQKPAAETHHWAERYPPESETTADDLTALCGLCHEMATTMRRFVRAGGDYYGFMSVLTSQFTGTVKMCQVRVNRTRAKFDDWSVTFRVDTDPELVDVDQLGLWLDIAGRRIGLGD